MQHRGKWMKRFAVVMSIMLLVLFAASTMAQDPTPMPAETPTLSPTETPLPTETLAPTATSVPPTETETPSPSPQPTNTLLPTDAPTHTYTFTPVLSETSFVTPTVFISETPLATATLTSTPVLPTVAWIPVFNDSFAAPDLTAWNFTEPGWAYAPQPNGSGRLLVFNSNAPAFYQGIAAADVAVEVTVEVSAGTAHLYARHSGAFGYEARLTPTGEVVLLRAGVVMTTVTLPNFVASVPHRLRLNDENGKLIVDVTITKILLTADGQPESADQPVPRSLNSSVVFEIGLVNGANISLTGLEVTDEFPAGLVQPIQVEGSPFTQPDPAINTWRLDQALPNTDGSDAARFQVSTTLVLPEELPSNFNDAYLNSVTVTLDSQYLAVNVTPVDEQPRNQAVKQVLPAFCVITGQYRPLPFRAPIRGNPGVPRMGSNPQLTESVLDLPLVIDAISRDPIIDGLLWAHVVDPEQVYPGLGEREVDPPLLNNWIMVNSTFQPRGFTGVSAGLGAGINQLLTLFSCFANGQIDDWSNYFEIDLGYNFPDPGEVSFTSLPVSVAQICAADSLETWGGLGVPVDGLYGVVGRHYGVDVFSENANTSNVSVFSVAPGIVVGIGEGRSAVEDNNRNHISQHSWGSAALTDDSNNFVDGYSVIVRSGHLYIVYGHLQAVSDRIYVGAPVGSGTFLGRMGRFRSSHVHVEVRNLYVVLNLNNEPDDGGNRNVILRTGLNSDNNHEYNRVGILDYQPNSRGFMYDFAQFYSNPNVLDPGTNTFIETILGLNVITGFASTEEKIAYGTNVYVSDDLLVNQGECERIHSVSVTTYQNSVGSDEEGSLEGYWRFRFSQDAPAGNLQNPFADAPDIP